MAITGDRIYFGETFSTIDGTDTHYKVATFDLTTHAPLSCNAWFNDHVDCIAVSPTGDTIFVGGELTFSGNGAFSNSRNGLAAYDKNGNLLGWNPNPGSYIFSLVVKNNTLYVGGNFTSISSTARNRLGVYLFSEVRRQNGTRLDSLKRMELPILKRNIPLQIPHSTPADIPTI